MAEAPKKRSLYADLLGDGASTISAAPVRYDASKADADSVAAAAAKKKDASLQFQPIKRPQVKAKSKPTATISAKFMPAPVTSSVQDLPQPAPTNVENAAIEADAPAASRIDQWRGDPDDNAYWAEQRRQERRAMQKEKKMRKKNKEQTQQRHWSWDDIYDPEAPNNYAAYKGSEAQYEAMSRWKAKLYHHKRKRDASRERSLSSGNLFDSSGKRLAIDELADQTFTHKPLMMFAPPPISTDTDAKAAFGPSRFLSDNDSISDDSYPTRKLSTSTMVRPDREESPPRMSFAPAFTPAAISENDPYSRRAAITFTSASSQSANIPPPPPVPPPQLESPLLANPSLNAGDFPQSIAEAPAHSNPVSPTISDAEKAAPVAKAKAQGLERLAAIKAKLNAAKPPPPPTVDSAPPPPPPPPSSETATASTTISRAPVRYEAPPNPSISTPDLVPVETSKRPGQSGFAKRLMMKQGWVEGSGLGRNSDGVTTAIVAQATKRKKRSDAEGGGWSTPANMGRIVGGKKRKIDKMADDDGSYGLPSVVVKLEGLLDGLDVDDALQNGDLMQDLGDRMEKCGMIKRLFIWREAQGGKNQVFVEFHSPLSALRAVNSTDGETFEGNPVVARFWDAEKFDKGVYE